MANININELTELTSPEDDDILLIEEEDAGSYESKKIKFSNLAPEKDIYIRAVGEAEAVVTGAGKFTFTCPFNCTITDVQAAVKTPSDTGAITVDVHNVDDTDTSVLLVKVTIDQDEYSSYTAGTPSDVDTNHDDISQGDRLRIDVDDDGDNAEGLDVIITVRKG